MKDLYSGKPSTVAKLAQGNKIINSHKYLTNAKRYFIDVCSKYFQDNYKKIDLMVRGEGHSLGNRSTQAQQLGKLLKNSSLRQSKNL